MLRSTFQAVFDDSFLLVIVFRRGIDIVFFPCLATWEPSWVLDSQLFVAVRC